MVQSHVNFISYNVKFKKAFWILLGSEFDIPEAHDDHDGNTFGKELIYGSYPYSVCAGIDHFAHSDGGALLFNSLVMTVSYGINNS